MGEVGLAASANRVKMGPDDPTNADSIVLARRSRETDRRLRACADLVRYCSEPFAAEARSFVESTLEGLRRGDSSCDARDAIDRAKSAVAAALQSLPVRQRLIIEKCDIAGNTANSVARALHLSRRHLFRERNEALEHVARVLFDSHEPRPVPLPRAADGPNRLDAAFTVSDSLMRIGHWSEARALLLDLLQNAPEADGRSGAAMRLARASRAKGDLTAAAAYLDRASIPATRPAEAWRPHAMAVARSYVELELGRTERADREAAVAERRLWGYCVDRPSSPHEAVEALVEAVCLRTAVAAGRGRFADATALADRAVEACLLFGLRGSIARRATVIRAMCDVFCERDVFKAEATLVELFKDSLGEGFPEDALVIAAHLARHLRLHGRAAEAISFLDLVAPFSKNIGSQEACFDILIEQIHSHLSLDRPQEAALHFAALRDLDAQRPMLVADMHLANASLELKRGAPRESRLAAEAAEKLYRYLNVERLVGIALRSQAEALLAEGRARKGMRAADDALEVMEETASPLELEKMRNLRTSILGKL